MSRYPENAPVALFDMDGTLCDFERAMVERLEEIAGPNDPPIDLYAENKPQWLRQRMRMIKNDVHWWEDLPEINVGISIFNLAVALGFRPMILTNGPRSHVEAWAGKVAWCYRHLNLLVGDKAPVDITITRDKGLVYGRVLVEDYPEYIERWLQHRPRGTVILMDRRSNQGYSHPQVIRFDGSTQAYDRVNQALMDAVNRPTD